jgi:hypothetical protein
MLHWGKIDMSRITNIHSTTMQCLSFSGVLSCRCQAYHPGVLDSLLALTVYAKPVNLDPRV